jgi:hypothetical protein
VAGRADVEQRAAVDRGVGEALEPRAQEHRLGALSVLRPEHALDDLVEVRGRPRVDEPVVVEARAAELRAPPGVGEPALGPGPCRFGEPSRAEVIAAVDAGAPDQPVSRDGDGVGALGRHPADLVQVPGRKDRDLPGVDHRDPAVAERRVVARERDRPAAAPDEARAVGALEDESGAGGRRVRGRAQRLVDRAGRCGDDQRHRRGEQREAVGEAHPAIDPGAPGHRLGRPRAELAVGERSDDRDRQRPADPEREPDGDADSRLAEREGDPGEGEDAEGEHERGEPEPEQDAVEARRERHRHQPAPALRELAAKLRQNREAAQLGERSGDGERSGGEVGGAEVGPLEQPAEQRQAPEREHTADQRAGRERDARRQGRRPAAVVAGGPDRLDHREAAWRPGAADAGEQRRDHEGDLETAQQGTFVWKYMTQKTLRPA